LYDLGKNVTVEVRLPGGIDRAIGIQTSGVSASEKATDGARE
jgi:hypothetical protein